jgi:mRNA-degrading endonuclease toxin of MazEF toxin-antitoxin module
MGIKIHQKNQGAVLIHFADSFQVKSVSVERVQRKTGNVTAQELTSIVDAIALCIGI